MQVVYELQCVEAGRRGLAEMLGHLGFVRKERLARAVSAIETWRVSRLRGPGRLRRLGSRGLPKEPLARAAT